MFVQKYIKQLFYVNLLYKLIKVNMKKRAIISIIGLFMAFTAANAQMRVVDALDKMPVSAASVFDASGNMVGFTTNDGVLSEVDQQAYPITLRCMGYEQLTIDQPGDKTWEMMPVLYELEELVVEPVKRTVQKQTFYVREYISMLSNTDTITVLVERMANRFVPISEDARFGGNSSLKKLNSRLYLREKRENKDSLTVDSDPQIPSMLSLVGLQQDEIAAPEHFKGEGDQVKTYEQPGKSGVSLLYRQNSHSFTVVEDMLAGKKEHSKSLWVSKLMGLSMNINQLYTTLGYIANEEGIYQPADLMEAGFVMEADAKGKLMRRVFKAENPAVIRIMVELYVVDRDYLSNDEAREQYKNNNDKIEFLIPDSVPPLNGATKRLVERAMAEGKRL